MARQHVGTTVTGSRCLAGILAGAILFAMAAGPAPAQTTAPAAAAPSASEESPPKTLAEIRHFTDREFALLQGAKDGTSGWIETPLYVLLRRAAWLPADSEAFAKEPRPDVNTFWTEPKTYRGQLVTVDAILADANPQTRTTDYNEWWPKKDYYLAYVAVSGGRSMLVALIDKPPAIKLGDKVRFTGFFYKTTELEAAKGTERQYPVFVARTIERVGAGEVVGSHRTLYMVTAIVVLVGLAGYLQWRIRVRKQRLLMLERVHALSHPVPAPQEDDGEFNIDPQLQQEVERFEAENEAAHSTTPPAPSATPPADPQAEKK